MLISAFLSLFSPAELAAYLSTVEAHPFGWLLVAAAGVGMVLAWKRDARSGTDSSDSDASGR